MEGIIDFFKESYAELRRVTWLSRREVMGSTVVIIILVTLIAIFVAAVDFVFLKLVAAVLSFK